MLNDFQKQYHLIVKSQPQNEDARRFLKPSRTFEKEVQMYGQVCKTYWPNFPVNSYKIVCIL